MSNNNSFRATHYLPQVAVATTLVAVMPVVVVWLLLVEGVISSPWVCVALAIALSFTASILGSAYWKRRSGPGDMLFSELLLWGWLHRFQSERRLAKALGLLGLDGARSELPESNESVERRAQILRQMATALDAQDPYTDGHSRRVALHAAMVARKMGLPSEEVAKIRTAAAVHDIGKLRIPSEVLNKADTLTPAEFEIVKRHAEEGAELVSSMEDPEISAMVRHHHERFDGAGYPAGLVGEQIPLGARIIAVADTFDALTSERPYRTAIAHKKALEVLLAVSATQLDPVAVRAFVKCYSGKRAILFWTLLAVSPQRALALVSGRNAASTSVGSAATVAMPAALAALVAVAVGSAGTVAHTERPVRLAARPSVLAISAHPAKAHHRQSAQRPPAAAASAPKHAVLGTAVTRKQSSGGARPRVKSADPPAPANSSGHGQARSGGGVRRPRSGSGHRGGRTHAPVVNPPPTSTAPPVPSGPAASGPTTGTGSGGGGGGNPGNGDGGSSGGGPGPPADPGSKRDCWDGGWMKFDFPNQGLCIAYVEHSLHGQTPS